MSVGVELFYFSAATDFTETDLLEAMEKQK